MTAESMQTFLAARGSSVLEARLSGLKSNERMGELLQLLQGPLGRFTGALRGLASALWDLLDLKFSDILIKTWNEAGILKKYLDPDEYQPDAEVSVVLSEHKITSEHHPYVDVLLDGVKLSRIVLDISLEFELDGIVLKIKDARIREIKTGACKAKGSVSYQGLLLLEEKTDSLDLPGSIRFERGVPIAP